jgi:RHS repeat-associated protein
VTGLLQMRNRYYSVELGRFLTRDPLGVWGDGMNLGNEVGYAGNRPLVVGDPLGLQAHSEAVYAAAGARGYLHGPPPAPDDTAGNVDWANAQADAARLADQDRRRVRDRFADACVASLMARHNPTAMIRNTGREVGRPDGVGGIIRNGIGNWGDLYIEVKCGRRELKTVDNNDQIARYINELSGRGWGSVLWIVKTSDGSLHPGVAELAALKGVGLIVSDVRLTFSGDGAPMITVIQPKIVVPPSGPDRLPVKVAPMPWQAGYPAAF